MIHWPILFKGSWNDHQLYTILFVILSVPTGAKAPWSMSSITGHLRRLTFFHWSLTDVGQCCHFCSPQSQPVNEEMYWFFSVFKNNTPKMGHWLLYISAPCACVPPSSQLYILIYQKQLYSHRFKTSQTTPEVRRIGWFFLFMFLTSDIVENSRDVRTLSFRSAAHAPNFQSVINNTSQYWSFTGF